MRASTISLTVTVMLSGLLAACGGPVDLAQALSLETVSSGWVASGIVDGKTMLVPSLSFRLKNGSERTLNAL